MFANDPSFVQGRPRPLLRVGDQVEKSSGSTSTHCPPIRKNVRSLLVKHHACRSAGSGALHIDTSLPISKADLFVRSLTRDHTTMKRGVAGQAGGMLRSPNATLFAPDLSPNASSVRRCEGLALHGPHLAFDAESFPKSVVRPRQPSELPRPSSQIMRLFHTLGRSPVL